MYSIINPIVQYILHIGSVNVPGTSKDEILIKLEKG